MPTLLERALLIGWVLPQNRLGLAVLALHRLRDMTEARGLWTLFPIALLSLSGCLGLGSPAGTRDSRL